MDDLKPSTPSEDTAASLKAETSNDSDSVPAKKSSPSAAREVIKERGLKPGRATKRWTSASMRLRRLRS